MAEGLEDWMRSKGFKSIEDFRGLSLPRVTEWKHLNLNYKIVAHIDEQKCIGCDLCHIACWDGAHQCIHLDRVSGPVNGQVELHDAPADCGMRTAAPRSPSRRSRARSAPSTGSIGPLSNAARQAFPAWMKPSASAATSARWSAPSTTASPWSASIPGSRPETWDRAHAWRGLRSRAAALMMSQAHQIETIGGPCSGGFWLCVRARLQSCRMLSERRIGALAPEGFN